MMVARMGRSKQMWDLLVARVANWLDTKDEREGIWNDFQVFWVEQRGNSDATN